jgi:hypothetical protein
MCSAIGAEIRLTFSWAGVGGVWQISMSGTVLGPFHRHAKRLQQVARDVLISAKHVQRDVNHSRAKPLAPRSRPAFCGKAEMESPVIHGSRLHCAAVFSLGSGVDDLRPTTQITPAVNLTKAELTHRDQAEQQCQRRLFVSE